MTRFNFDEKETIMQDGNAIAVCGPQTGHAWRAVAFCENSAITTQILDALKLWHEHRNKAVSS